MPVFQGDTPGPKPELRDGETIRAYLEELVRLKSPLQLWIGAANTTPFETTLQKVSPITFTTTTTTPQLSVGQLVNFSFMLDSRRFTSQARVVASGVFRIPPSIFQDERRVHFRGPFDRSDQARVFAAEQFAETILCGRTILGRLLNLSVEGLRVALDDVATLSAGTGPELKVGDRFAFVSISDLHLTPPIHGHGRVTHLVRTPAEAYAGFHLEGLDDADRRNIERLLIPRLPTTFGEVFPTRKRKTDFADQPGTPTLTQVVAKAPEMVSHVLDRTGPAAAPERPAITAVMRLRKASRKIMFLSAHPGTPALAEAFRQDGFKQVSEAKSFLDAKALAEQSRFDLLVLDIRVGSQWAKDIMETMASHNLLRGTAVILVVDHRNEGAVSLAAALDAVHLQERRNSAEELLPVVCKLLLEESPAQA